jgi:hypothetical protein
LAIIQDRDLMGNNRSIGGENFAVSLTGLSLADCPQIQASVLRDISCKCEGLFLENIQECKNIPVQLQPGSELSMTIAPELTCLYRRNEIDCTIGCCPNGSLGSCSTFTLPPTYGKSARPSDCVNRSCASLERCALGAQTARQKQQSSGNLFKTFLQNTRNGCPQLERLGLEAGFLLPPDDGAGTYFLIMSNLDPNRPSWRGPMLPEEVQAWISSHDLARLYYTRARNSNGELYFSRYDASTLNKSNIEGFVSEQLEVFGRQVLYFPSLYRAEILCCFFQPDKLYVHWPKSCRSRSQCADHGRGNEY